jgi:hypothetical protein
VEALAHWEAAPRNKKNIQTDKLISLDYDIFINSYPANVEKRVSL